MFKSKFAVVQLSEPGSRNVQTLSKPRQNYDVDALNCARSDRSGPGARVYAKRRIMISI
jgi:hypothetical protein